MRYPLLIALAALAVVIAALVFWRAETDRGNTGAGVDSPGKTSAEETGTSQSGSSPSGPKNGAAFAASAADYELDAPRRRDELGRALPFRERPLATSGLEWLRRGQAGNFASLDLFPGVTLRARITGKWEDENGTRVAAALEGRAAKDRLFASWHKDGMRTLIELPSENLAYEILDDGRGGYLVREWLFTDVVCATPSARNRGADSGIPPPERGVAQGSASYIEPGQVPQLSSRPGSPAVIYLDFDGETVSGSAWANGATIVASPARLNVSQIEETWRRVVRDFETFNVNVTTVRATYDAASMARKTHCVITPTTTAAPGAGGVAYVGIFDDPNPAYKVCWAFADTNAKDCGEVISHEVGHTLGLGHDGRSASGSLAREDYYGGHGFGSTGWAPIMGVGYYQQLTQWSKGEYARANNTQDDLAIITVSTQTPYLADDAGSTLASALAVTGDRAAGRVERNTDADFFSINLQPGSYSLIVQPDSFTNLDLELQVFDALGNPLTAAANPLDQLNATASLTLGAPQTVYLRVAGAGKGDLLGSGYSNYSSLGTYTITGFGDQQQPPSPPIGLSLSRVSGTQMRLSWTPNPSAASYQIFRSGLLIATTAETEFLDIGLSPSTEYSYAVVAVNSYGSSAASDPSVLTTSAFDEFVMDGNADFPGYLVSNPGMTIYAAVRGTKLYVATWSPGDNGSGFGSDHHIFVSDSLLASATTAAPWSKRGLLAIAGNKPFLAGEGSSTYAGWFNTAGAKTLFKAPLNSGVLEGSIDLVSEFGSLPESVYIAAVAYQTEDANQLDASKGKINSQAPVGNGNDNLEPNEFFRVPVRSARDTAQNGSFDVLDAARAFAVTNVSFNPSKQPVLRWPVLPGKSYMVQGRPAFGSGSWSNLLVAPWGADANQWDMEFTDMTPPAATRFYRVTQP
jgi:hypothetical protein